MINLVSLTIPSSFGAEIASCITVLCIRPIFLPDMAAKATAMVTIPIPPICIRNNITACPKSDQYVAVS